MDNISHINIIGQDTPVRLLSKAELRGVYVDAIAGFDFYEASFRNECYVLLHPKGGRSYTPTMLATAAARIGKILGKPVVFWLDGLTTTQRDRIVAKGIYFVVPGKYASLPFLVINRLTTDSKEARSLSPAAQYLLLFHLQKQSLDSKSASMIAETLPYRYVTVTKAMKELAELGLCEIETVADRSRALRFPMRNDELWAKALPYMTSPIKDKLYCDEISTDFECEQCGINALSHYSDLNPERMQSYALTKEAFAAIKPNARGLNSEDGSICIEVWKYAPIPMAQGYVDKLSLFLSLADNKDPRIEKELELMIENLW